MEIVPLKAWKGYIIQLKFLSLSEIVLIRDREEDAHRHLDCDLVAFSVCQLLLVLDLQRRYLYASLNSHHI